MTLNYITEKSLISRRSFIYDTSTAAAALVTVPSAIAQTNKPLTAGEINNYLNSLGTGWVDFNKTVDGFDSCSPESVAKGFAVVWTSYTWALKKAYELGCNIFVTHETPFYEHRIENEKIFIHMKLSGRNALSSKSQRSLSFAAMMFGTNITILASQWLGENS